jgi:hypothetical protein
MERFDDAADRWTLAIQVFPQEQLVLRDSVPGQPRPFYNFMRKLGKMGLETDASVRALFYRAGEVRVVPPLPRSIDYPDGAFTHVIGYDLARIDEFGEMLYEVTIRKPTEHGLMVETTFTYRTTLDENFLRTVLERATRVAGLVSVENAPQSSKESGEGARSSKEAQ